MPGEDTGAAPAAAAEAQVSAADILAFDPFEPATDDTGTSTTPAAEAAAGTSAPSTEGQPPEGTQTAGNPPPADPAATQQAPVTTPAQMAPPPPQPDPTLQEIRDLLASQTKSAQTEQPAASVPKYNLAMPPQVVQALRSEDEKEFALGMHAVINGIANRIWQDVTQHLQTEFAPAIVQQAQVQTTQRTELQRMNQDFFGTHKSLDNDLLRPLVQQAGALVLRARAAQGQSLDWSTELRDAIADEVYKVVPHLRPAPPAASPAQQTQQPRYVAGGGSRPPQQQSTGNDFTDVLF